MIGTCSKCHKLYDFGSEEAAYEPDRLCVDCYRQANAKQIYKIEVVAEADADPFTGLMLPERRETLTIAAASLDEARRLAPVYMTIKVRGQLLRFFNSGVELLGNF